MISQNSDCLALLAFSQTILLKYIAENNKYKVKTKFNIISSEYTKDLMYLIIQISLASIK